MVFFSQSCQLRISELLIFLLLEFGVAYQLGNQSILAASSKIDVKRNATITIGKGCPCTTNSNCNGIQSNFTLPPGVCLSLFTWHFAMKISEVPQCVDGNGTFPPQLVTYGGENCTGFIVPPLNPPLSPGMCIPSPWPSQIEPGPIDLWSIIFHCHRGAFDKTLEPSKYTYGGQLQEPVKPHIPLALCERRKSSLVDGLAIINYIGCLTYWSQPRKFYPIPPDTCQSTNGGKAIKILKPAFCRNDSRSKLALYLDDECQVIGDMTPISDTNITEWGDSDICRVLDDRLPHVRSFAFYCDGLSNVTEASSPRERKATTTKDLVVFNSTTKPTEVPIPPKPWVPFWKGLVLINKYSGWSSKEDHFDNPTFQTVPRDTCVTFSISPLKFYQVPRCSNGTRAHVALFWGSNCYGPPVFYDGNSVLDQQFCMSESTGYSSLAFWCSGPHPNRWEDFKYPPPRFGEVWSSGNVGFLLIIILFWLLLVIVKIFQGYFKNKQNARG